MEQNNNNHNFGSGDLPPDPFEGEDMSALLVDALADAEDEFLSETLEPLNPTADEKQILMSDPFGLSPELQEHCVRLAYLSAFERVMNMERDGYDEKSKELLDILGGWIISSESHRIGGPARAAMALYAYDMYGNGLCDMLWSFGHNEDGQLWGTVRFAPLEGAR